MFVGHLDTSAAHAIAGWAWNAKENQSTSVVIKCPDGVDVKVPATLPRPDVAEKLNIGQGCGFTFSLSIGQICAGYYTVHFENGELMPNGVFCIAGESIQHAVEARWRGDEAPEHLTWGRPMTGDTFVDFMLRNGLPTFGHHRYIEAGPGYGRILRTLVKREIPIAQYAGIELSPARTKRLHDEFTTVNRNIRFYCGSCQYIQIPERFDIFFCSSTFEHLHPDFSAAMKNIKAHMVSGGRLYIDLPQADDQFRTSIATFDASAFVRIYSVSEIEEIVKSCGIEIDGMESIFLGEGIGGDGMLIPILRIAVAAQVK